MPRFSLRSVLIAFAAVALWFSTFAGYAGAEDVRAFLLLSILISSGAAAVCYTARRRAFWAGFCAAMLVMGTKTFFTTFGANVRWAMQLSRDLGGLLGSNRFGGGHLVISIHHTIFVALMLTMATFIGLMCVYIYDQSRK